MYLDSLDIGNSAVQKLGLPPILDINEDSKVNREISTAYDKLRRAELRRNVWAFSIRFAPLRPMSPTMMEVSPALWDSGTTYLPGAVVKDANNDWWLSTQPDNIGNVPNQSNVWDQYFGPQTADVYDPTLSYYAGELVYMPGTNPGSFVVFMSLQSGNTAAPNVSTPWSATTSYGQDAVVSYNGSMWRSLIPVNLNITPAVGPLAFNLTTTYSISQTVTGSDGYIYTSVGNSNLGHDPTTDGGVHWTNTTVPNGWSNIPALFPAASGWHPLFCSLKTVFLIYPIGTGPSYQTNTLNVFRLPRAYLRTAPQDPKAGATNYLGAPSGTQYEDWVISGDYMITSMSQIVVLRFAADVTQVTKMDDMFCEGLAARIAFETCETLTQSSEKKQNLASEYQKFMTEARIVNGIEEGPTEPPIDDFIACRI